ncbi:MAG: response regulator [Candidatus Nomurabacteria bacterium]|jgi:DNA-binding response OmpR family regulator|nr:response regulator [Candidatus Nomurabacteria bacterium]
MSTDKKPYKIAIVEDDITISQMYRMKFELEGHKVDVAHNGREGVELVKQVKPDIILLDIMMPEVDGVQCLKEIRKIDEFAQTPTLILTNLGQEEASPELQKLAVEKYIIKSDTTPRQITEIVTDVLNNHPALQ